jgi:hypothetical protein
MSMPDPSPESEVLPRVPAAPTAPSPDEGMNLSHTESRIFAMWLAARHLDAGDWLEWEDVPNLGEFAFFRLDEAAVSIADDLAEQAKKLAEYHDIDPAFLHERATS